MFRELEIPFSLVSIRPPSEDRGKPPGLFSVFFYILFQSAPHPKTGGNKASRCQSWTDDCFNPPPIRRQGETRKRWAVPTEHTGVSIRPPSEDRGKLCKILNICRKIHKFQSAPHPKTGGNVRGFCLFWLLFSFNPPPIRRQGETGEIVASAEGFVVSIRPPSEDRGKPASYNQYTPPEKVFQSAPHPKTGGNGTGCWEAGGLCSFNPPPIRRQGETLHLAP